MYFTLSQIQSVVVILGGGLLLVLILIGAYWSFRLNLARRGPEEAPTEKAEAAEPAASGDKPIPLLLILVTIAVVIWGVAYILAVALGGLYVQ